MVAGTLVRYFATNLDGFFVVERSGAVHVDIRTYGFKNPGNWLMILDEITTSIVYPTQRSI